MRKFTRHGILTVCLLFLSIPLAICQQQSKTQAPVMSNGKSPFEGEWEWEKNDLNNNFVLKIVKEGNYLKGTYCSVMQKGAKVDCLQKDGTSFAAPVPGSTSFIAHFKSAYTPINGKVKLTFDGFNIVWEIVDKPKGLYYGPSSAVLVKQR